MTHLQHHSRNPGAGSESWRPRLVAVRSFVLLAGSVRSNSFSSQLRRSVLDLPLSESERLLDIWEQRIRSYLDGVRGDRSGSEIRVLAGSHVAPERTESELAGLPFRVDHDAGRFRGTAGVLRDLCADLAPHELVLVGTASQCPAPAQIENLVSAVDPQDGVTLSADADGAPTGLLVARGEALQSVAAVGYIDLKQQALPQIAASLGVRVVRATGDVSRPIRDVVSYVDVVRSWNQSGSLAGGGDDPFEERWRPAFSIVEDGALVHGDTRLHDAVVLAGGEVQQDATVVRSVVGPGGVVRRGEVVVGAFVGDGSAR